MALTDIQCRNAKPKNDGKATKLFDGHGLYLHVTEKTKTWRLKYYIGGKEKLATIGQYPSVKLADAKKIADTMRDQAKQGIDPVEYRKKTKQELIAQAQAEKIKAITFKDAFDEWYKVKQKEWSHKHAQAIQMQFNMYLQPIANKPLEEIKPLDCIELLKGIESQGKLSTLDKTKRQLSQIMRYAVSTGKLNSDPSRDILKEIFTKRKKENFAHQTDALVIQEIFQNICLPYRGHISVHSALKFVPLTFLRASEITGLKWSEVDIDKKLLRIEAERMKKKREHIVPLSTQALAIIQLQQAISLSSKYVFPSPRNLNGHISTQALLTALRKQGVPQGEFTNHGWRHAASTTLHEQAFNTDWIEIQLAHVTPSTRGVYNKAQYLVERTKMMQAWADFLHGIEPASP